MDKEALFRPRLPEDDVQVPGVGTVRVRGLSRVEVLQARKATDEATMDGPRMLTLERKMLAAALVDPALSEAEVGKWQAVAPAGELVPLIQAIERLSGLSDDAPKSGVAGDGGEPGPRV
jgi:hypothetical protein